MSTSELSSEATKKIRLDILKMVFEAKEGHIPSSFSIVELLYVLYAKMGDHDTFFLSKGHASAALFAVLSHFGIIKDDLSSYCSYNSELGGHPNRGVPGVINSSGSLGHGFPMAAGYAFSKKIKKEPGRVFCIIGDGESNEGTIWETAMYAEHLELNNLICIVDLNNSQTRAVTSINLIGKFEGFGWRTVEIDGHNLAQIDKYLFENQEQKKPFCLVASTKKGKGLKELEDNFFAWHHRVPTIEEYGKFKEELQGQEVVARSSVK